MRPSRQPANHHSSLVPDENPLRRCLPPLVLLSSHCPEPAKVRFLRARPWLCLSLSSSRSPAKPPITQRNHLSCSSVRIPHHPPRHFLRRSSRASLFLCWDSLSPSRPNLPPVLTPPAVDPHHVEPCPRSSPTPDSCDETGVAIQGTQPPPTFRGRRGTLPRRLSVYPSVVIQAPSILSPFFPTQQ